LFAHSKTRFYTPPYNKEPYLQTIQKANIAKIVEQTKHQFIKLQKEVIKTQESIKVFRQRGYYYHDFY